MGSLLEEFSIFFDVGFYDTIQIVGTPTGWDGIAVEPDPGIPDGGFADYLGLSGGLAAGASLGGFQVSFNWLGQDAPSGQTFSVIDPITFETLESGTTRIGTVTPPPTEVPEPGTLALLTFGLSVFRFARRRRA